jgi:hypothetical protein
MAKNGLEYPGICRELLMSGAEDLMTAAENRPF